MGKRTCRCKRIDERARAIRKASAWLSAFAGQLGTVGAVVRPSLVSAMDRLNDRFGRRFGSDGQCWTGRRSAIVGDEAGFQDFQLQDSLGGRAGGSGVTYVAQEHP
jgi:hypothetical protein